MNNRGILMDTDRVSIIIDDKNQHHNTIEKAVSVIKDQFGGSFTVGNLMSLDLFLPRGKKYLRSIFLHNITIVHAWEHSFYLQKGKWKYENSIYDYKNTIKDIMLLLNTHTNTLGKEICPGDYQLIKNLWRDWLHLLNHETRWILYEYNYFNENEFIEFVSNNLKNRMGYSCTYNYKFIKAFFEAKYDYHVKKASDAILGIKVNI